MLSDEKEIHRLSDDWTVKSMIYDKNTYMNHLIRLKCIHFIRHRIHHIHIVKAFLFFISKL